MQTTKQYFEKLANSEKREYILDIFGAVQNVYPIYQQIYQYLVSHNEIPSEILGELFVGVEKLQTIEHDEKIKNRYNTLMTKIGELEKQEADEEEKDLENLLLNFGK